MIWRFEDGTLRLVANFAEMAQAFDMEPDETEIWRSPGLAAEASSLGSWQARLTRSGTE